MNQWTSHKQNFFSSAYACLTTWPKPRNLIIWCFLFARKKQTIKKYINSNALIYFFNWMGFSIKKTSHWHWIICCANTRYFFQHRCCPQTHHICSCGAKMEDFDNITESDPINPGIPLSLMTCFYTDFPHHSRNDCSISEPDRCYFCPIHGKFTTNEGLDDLDGPGHTTCLVLGSLGFIISVFGTFTNALIITILSKKSSPKAFDTMLLALAWCDLFCCVSGLVSAMSVMFYFREFETNKKVQNKKNVTINTLFFLLIRKCQQRCVQQICSLHWNAQLILRYI